jgi:hypothetical protein
VGPTVKPTVNSTVSQTVIQTVVNGQIRKSDAPMQCTYMIKARVCVVCGAADALRRLVACAAVVRAVLVTSQNVIVMSAQH